MENKFVSVGEHLRPEVGNAMSVNILTRVLAKLLPASGIVAGPLVDPWG